MIFREGAVTARVICVGHAALDRTFFVDAWPASGESAKIAARGFRESGGGMAANAAVAVARLGGVAAFWGPAGADREGAIIRDELVRYGVDVGGLALFPGRRSSVSAILVDPTGERLIIGFRSDTLTEEPAWLPLASVCEAGAVLADVRWPKGAKAVLECARSLGVPAILDADVAPPDTFASLAECADHVLFSAAGLTAFAPGASVADALGAALRLGARIAGVTRGSEGFYWLAAGGDGIRHVPSPSVRTIDTTGAGDAFHGAYALAIAEGASTSDAASFACAAAALKCTRPGSRDAMPTRPDVEALLDGVGARS